MAARKKYLCIGAVLQSANDGQWHYIPAHRLPQLYGVDPRLCLFLDRPNHARLFVDSLIQLRPDPSGAYRAPA